jgi:hypothetical protein
MYHAVLKGVENTIRIIRLMQVIFSYLILYNEWTLYITMFWRLVAAYVTPWPMVNIYTNICKNSNTFNVRAKQSACLDWLPLKKEDTTVLQNVG